ncbi:hypothetical protein ACJX0J_020060, partial [Zea mays]
VRKLCLHSLVGHIAKPVEAGVLRDQLTPWAALDKFLLGDYYHIHVHRIIYPCTLKEWFDKKEEDNGDEKKYIKY